MTKESGRWDKERYYMERTYQKKGMLLSQAACLKDKKMYYIYIKE